MGLIMFAFIIGGVGFYLNIIDISIPIWLDTALTTLPYFVIGNMLWTKTSFMLVENSFRHCLLFSGSLFVMFVLVFSMEPNDNIFYAVNRYTNVSIVRLYLCGFAGSFFIVLLSKFIGKIPVVSYIGRYSIVVLITHQFYLFVIRNILYQMNVPQDSVWVSLGVFIIVVLISLPTIKYGIRYLPYCFAQKDLLL
jgi:fucose 4-O-acetylase-like acetyltransferase